MAGTAIEGSGTRAAHVAQRRHAQGRAAFGHGMAWHGMARHGERQERSAFGGRASTNKQTGGRAAEPTDKTTNETTNEQTKRANTTAGEPRAASRAAPTASGRSRRPSRRGTRTCVPCRAMPTGGTALVRPSAAEASAAGRAPRGRAGGRVLEYTAGGRAQGRAEGRVLEYTAGGGRAGGRAGACTESHPDRRCVRRYGADARKAARPVSPVAVQMWAG